MSDTLDPANLTPSASLNRVRFTELAGLGLPTGMVGWAAYALLSARALATLTTRHGADDAARRFGERLGWLLVTLRQGDPASRAARPDWDDSYWDHWASIKTVYLGGGIVSGASGPGVALHAQRVLANVGMMDCTVAVAPWPEHLPLIGAARAVSEAAPETGSSVVLDFGQSFVKRGLVEVTDRTVTAIRIAPRIGARFMEIGHGGSDPTAEEIERLGDEIVRTMAETWRAASVTNRDTGRDVSTTVVASIAAYVRDGQPLARQGGAYSYLLGLSDRLDWWLGERLSSVLDRPMSVRLLHDGTAAGLALAGVPNAAVIALGTALGVGFPPSDEACRPLSSQFVVRDPHGQPSSPP
jgi:hypothetical protein